MKKPHGATGMQEEGQKLLSAALAALRARTAIEASTVELSGTSASRHRAAAVDLAFDHQSYRYLVECKTYVDRKAQLDQISLQLGQLDGPVMLATDYLTQELAAHCRHVGLQFIDTHGNAYLRAPGLLVFTTGEKSVKRRLDAKPPKGLTSQAALRVVFALLSKPELVNATFKDIAALSRVALGTAYNVLGDLEQRGYLLAGSQHGRSLLEPQRLIEEWVANYPTTLRSKLHTRRFSAPDPTWWRDIDLVDFHAVWGSEVAAATMVKHLKPATQTLYVDPERMAKTITMLAKKFRLQPDPSGPIEILEKFWDPAIESSPELAPPLLVYSDLLALLDPRTRDTANLMREKVIASANHPG